FIILDDCDVYHIGASLKDLGNKIFAFSKISIDCNDILKRL
ncbi:MAG: ORF6N domain-containing protein, partial [Candidatus Paceibacteria bacterium]